MAIMVSHSQEKRDMALVSAKILQAFFNKWLKSSKPVFKSYQSVVEWNLKLYLLPVAKKRTECSFFSLLLGTVDSYKFGSFIWLKCICHENWRSLFRLLLARVNHLQNDTRNPIVRKIVVETVNIKLISLNMFAVHENYSG